MSLRHHATQAPDTFHEQSLPLEDGHRCGFSQQEGFMWHPVWERHPLTGVCTGSSQIPQVRPACTSERASGANVPKPSAAWS